MTEIGGWLEGRIVIIHLQEIRDLRHQEMVGIRIMIEVVMSRTVVHHLHHPTMIEAVVVGKIVIMVVGECRVQKVHIWLTV